MSKSPPALVEPRLLTWARNSARLSVEEVAEKLKLPVTRLHDWEQGNEHPSIAQLRKLADIYRRPLAVFFLSEPPRDFDALRDFRRTASEGGEGISDNLLLELRRTQELRDAALSMVPEGELVQGPTISARLVDDPEQLATRLRFLLGVRDEDQLSWNGAYAALRSWRTLVEGLGVLVVNMSGVDVAEARGFSIAHWPFPLISLNAKDRPNGRVFTLMHELVHLSLHEGGICEWSRESRLTGPNRRIEAFCNQVAAAILLPRSLIYVVIGGFEQASIDDWPDEDLRRFSQQLSVSEETFVRRLVTLGLATNDFYSAKRNEYIDRYAEIASTPSSAVVPYERRVVSSLGTAYLNLAYTAYYERRLTLSELSSYTGVRISNLGKVEREAFGISRMPGGES